MGSTGQVDSVAGSREPESQLGGALEGFSLGSEYPRSEEDRTHQTREIGQEGESREKEGRGSRSQMMVTLCRRKYPEVIKWGEELLLTWTSPKEGTGAPSVESLRTGQDRQEPQQHVSEAVGLSWQGGWAG